MENKQTKNSIITLIYVIVGALLLSANVKIFVHAGNLIPGGFSGLTLLIQRIFSTFLNIEIPYSFLYYALNAIPVYIGFKMIGKKFTFYSCVSIVLAGLFVDLIPTQTVTLDPLLIAIFGGIVNGVAIGVTLKGKASTGGTDFLAMYISKKYNVSSWNYVLGFNVCIQIMNGFLFSWDAALYSIIFQFVQTQVVNVLHVRYQKVTLSIMTTKADELADRLLAHTHHGVTRFEGIGCYTKEPVTMLYTVISSEEMREVMKFVHHIDEHAFINVTKTISLEGRFYQSPIE